VEKFPDFINSENCYKILEKNQLEYVKQVRKSFCDKILWAIENLHENILLEFTPNIWYDNRVMLCKELLDRFGSVEIKTIQRYTITKSISDTQNIPQHIESIKITF